MIGMELRQAADVLQCAAPAEDATFKGITTDSRKVSPGMLFAALGGRNFDGHDHVGHLPDGNGNALGVLNDRPKNSGVFVEILLEAVFLFPQFGKDRLFQQVEVSPIPEE